MSIYISNWVTLIASDESTQTGSLNEENEDQSYSSPSNQSKNQLQFIGIFSIFNC